MPVAPIADEHESLFQQYCCFFQIVLPACDEGQSSAKASLPFQVAQLFSQCEAALEHFGSGSPFALIEVNLPLCRGEMQHSPEHFIGLGQLPTLGSGPPGCF